MGKTDCSRCVGLCCVALAFDRSRLFAFDKPAGVPCAHLTADDRCGIHHELGPRGFGGCIRYDCGGAGQSALAAIRRSWREGPIAANALFDAFRDARDVNEAHELLGTARSLPLSSIDEERRADLASRLGAEPSAELAAEVRAFLRGLRALDPS